MKVLLTRSSGQIGTNLALRLLADGHEVFGVDQRVNTWTNDFQYLLQDLSGQYPAFPDGIGGALRRDLPLTCSLRSIGLLANQSRRGGAACTGLDRGK